MAVGVDAAGNATTNRPSVTDKIKLGLSHTKDKTMNKMHQTSEMLRASGVAIKGGMSTVGDKLKTVMQNINCGGNLDAEQEANLARS
jgi:hypothetical protein